VAPKTGDSLPMPLHAGTGIGKSAEGSVSHQMLDEKMKLEWECRAGSDSSPTPIRPFPASAPAHGGAARPVGIVCSGTGMFPGPDGGVDREMALACHSGTGMNGVGNNGIRSRPNPPGSSPAEPSIGSGRRSAFDMTPTGRQGRKSVPEVPSQHIRLSRSGGESPFGSCRGWARTVISGQPDRLPSCR